MMHFELPKTFHKTPIALDLSVVVGQYKGFWGGLGYIGRWREGQGGDTHFATAR